MEQKKSIFDNPMLRTKVRSANVKFPEMLFGYLVGPFGALLASGIFASFLNKYFTDVLFKGETSAALTTFATLLPLLSTILIVIGNLVMGQLIERTRTKAGKARPWILMSAVTLTIACISMFIIPGNSSMVVKMVWYAIGYNLYYSFAYPMYSAANSTMIPVSTRNGSHRSLLATFSNVAGLGVMGGSQMIFGIIVSNVLKESMGAWAIAFVAVGAFTFLCCLIQYYFTRERVTEELLAQPVQQEKISMKKQIKAVTSDKYWWIVIIFYLLFQFSGALKNGAMAYYCQWNLDLSLVGNDYGIATSVLAIAGAIPMAAAALFVYPLINKFGKQPVVIVGMIVGVIGGIIAIIAGDNFIVATAGVALKCLGSAPAGYMILAMLADVLDHGEAKNGFRCDGFTMSIYSAIMAAATPLGTAIFNALIGVGSTYNPEAATQSAGVIQAISISYIWVETIAYALIAVILLFFVVEKHGKEDREAILARQKAEAEAAGIEWIEPEERLRLEQEKADREADEARKAELKEKCEKKGLNFEEEEAKYQKTLAEKKAKAEAKAAAKKKK